MCRVVVVVVVVVVVIVVASFLLVVLSRTSKKKCVRVCVLSLSLSLSLFSRSPSSRYAFLFSSSVFFSGTFGCSYFPKFCVFVFRVLKFKKISPPTFTSR